MTCLALLIIAYGALVVETALTGVLPVGAVPDTVAALVLAWCLVAPARLTVWGAALLGLLIDLNGSGRLGLGLAVAVTMAVVLVHLRGPGVGNDWPRRVLTTLVAALAMVVVTLLRERLAMADSSAAGGWLVPVVLMTLGTAALALGCIPLLRQMFGRSWRRSEGF